MNQRNPVSVDVGHLNNVSGIFGWLDSKLDTVIKPRFIVIIFIVIGMFYFIISRTLGSGDSNDSETTILVNTSILEILL